MNIATIDAENTAMCEAVAFCRGADNRWLADLDPWIAQAMISATTDEGFKPAPDPSRAIAVESNSISTADVDGSLIVRRPWRYVSDLNGAPVAGLDSEDHLPMSSCHRCTGFEPFERKRAQATFYIPRGRFVVEFAFCADCMVRIASVAKDLVPEWWVR
ncbi:hypothetical protein D8Y23_08935 [Microbacterium enclense]|uniref:Uncharacterized protein n=1 Tax=Microbacterium enclense TaxID=993073 RepID=A0A3S3LKE2_9MICO|nr:hypothetical protein [Microbacterium enclense]RWR18883.1 hypothetical protein D8Y23_08935 [Microbacterium enclense]